jgi:hypothetical protein
VKRLVLAASGTLAIVLSAAPAERSRAATPEATASPSAAPDYVAVVGPLHGTWLLDGKPAALGEKIAAGATFAQVRPGTPASIAIYVFDGRLVTKTCPTDPGCGAAFALDPPGDTAGIKSVVEDATKALAHYRFAYATPAPESSPPATPVDGVAPLGTDGVVDLGDLMQGVALGPYRVVLRPLDPHSSFVPAGDPIIKLVTWNGEAVSVAVGGVPTGLYVAQLFSRDLANRALGGPAWAAVIGARGESARAEYRSARALTAKWNDPEATQLFLRSYLVNAVFPQQTPGPDRRRHRS